MITNLRNIAIIAHVDHGKSTLVDAMLKYADANIAKSAHGEMVMDANELERERGITIFSKNAAVIYKGTKINIIDTPGHADFGGEVERVLNMADGSLLLVDAQEGPMPQTRFVLKKALLLSHKIIVVINKIDKKNARVHHVLEKVIELFIELGATNEQIDFPVIYAAGKLGRAGLTPELERMADIVPVFEAVLEHIPAPNANPAGPLQLMVTSIAYDNYKGRIGIGRIQSGSIREGQAIAHISRHEEGLQARNGKIKNAKVTSLLTFMGLSTVAVSSLEAGDIAAIAGLEQVNIGDTIADAENPIALTPIAIEKPTVKMIFAVNTSPFAGTEAQYSTSRTLRERLMRELDNDVALRVDEGASPDEFIVSGRGELHLSILIEKMRREGFELQVSRPEVILKEENSVALEPFEDVWIEVKEEYAGLTIEKMSGRKGALKNMNVENGMAHFHFFIPTRGFIGFRNEFLVHTKGMGLMNALFAGYFPAIEDIAANLHGSLIAHEAGTATSYALLGAQERGVLFIGPGANVYEGQVVGRNAKTMDLTVNVCKQKQLNNFRAKTEAVSDDLISPRDMPLEAAIEYIGADELVEVTPRSIRIRKRILRNAQRK